MHNIHENAHAPKNSAALTKGIHSFGFKLFIICKKPKTRGILSRGVLR